jgi:hypothetical protein
MTRRLADLDRHRRRLCRAGKRIERGESGPSGFLLQIIAYRRMDSGLGEALLSHIKWVPFFAVFFGGMSYHLSTALLAHLFGYNSELHSPDIAFNMFLY